MNEIIREIRESFREGSALTRLIYINLAVFVILKVFQAGFFLSGRDFLFYYWLMLPSDLTLLLYRPWTLVTYMFLHNSFIHILSNLLVLYWFGKIFQSYFKDEKMVSLYFLGGFAGALTYLAAYNIFPVFENVRNSSFLLGASASVIAILLASAFFDPNREIVLFLIGKVQLKYIALFLVILYIIGITATNPGGNLAHLGGAFMGYLFTRQEKKGNEIGTWITRLINKAGSLSKTQKKVKISYKQTPRDDYEFNRQKTAKQQEINRILDKISRSGYDSLSKDEKEMLFRQGKNN